MKSTVLLLSIVVASIVFFQPYISMVFALKLPFWHLDAPVADLFGVLLLLFSPVWLRLPPRSRIPTLAPVWYGGFLLAVVLSAVTYHGSYTDYSTVTAMKWTLRKPIFLYLAYGLALPLAISRCPKRLIMRVLYAAIMTAAVLSIVTSVGRIIITVFNASLLGET